MEREDPDVARIAQEIKAYLDANPQAAETLDGIVHWWLLRQRFEDAWNQVERALDYLSEEGFVTKGAQPSGEIVYSSTRRNREPERGGS